MLYHRATRVSWSNLGTPGQTLPLEYATHPSMMWCHLHQPWDRVALVHCTPGNTGQQIQLVRSQAQNLYFWLFLFFPSSFFLLFSMHCLSSLYQSPKKNINFHFSLALYVIRPDCNRPGLKCIILAMTVTTIKHSFNRKKNYYIKKRVIVAEG